MSYDGPGCSGGAKRSVSIPWPITSSFFVGTRKLSGVAVTHPSTTAVASRSNGRTTGCAYHSSIGTRRAFATGANRSAKVGAMCAKQASIRRSRRTRARSR